MGFPLYVAPTTTTQIALMPSHAGGGPGAAAVSAPRILMDSVWPDTKSDEDNSEKIPSSQPSLPPQASFVIWATSCVW